MTRLRTDRFADTMIVRSRRRALARVLAVLFVAAMLAVLAHVALARDLTSEDAPDFALKSTAGKNLRLSEYRSEVVAVAFWASWCGACRKDLATLEKLQRELGAKGLRILGVSFDKDMRVARNAAEAARLTFPVLLDDSGEVGRLYDVARLPLVVLVDREGRIRASYEGGRSSERALATQIRALVEE